MLDPDITKLFRYDFDYKDQARLCAAAIQEIRCRMGSDWKDLCLPKADRHPRIRDRRQLVKNLIRVAGESTDHRRTVDFTTKAAATWLVDARENHNLKKSLIGHLSNKSQLAHEHMVPCEVVLRELVEAPVNASLYEILQPLTYRALICKPTEGQKLDEGQLKSELPLNAKTRLATAIASRAVPPQFKALLRYEAIEALENLIPLSKRAKKLHRVYMKFAA